jgi:glycosyltransferase involved in cell wall biosynthesis
MKIAIIHDWLVTYAGAERVLEQIIKIYPNADIFSIVDFIPDNQRGFLLNKKVNTSHIQKLPLAKKMYRNYLPIMTFAIEQFDLSSYDVIISSSHAVAKGVITGPNQLHLSYIHTPIRYAWDLQHQYLLESGLKKGFKGLIAKWLLHKIRNWDYRTSNGVDVFIANSKYISRRIWKVYRRTSDVIYPPVDVTAFGLKLEKDEYYITASRMVPYKKIDLIVESFSKMPDKQLIVIGDGPDFDKIKKNAPPNVQLLGYQPFEVLVNYMQKAQAFVFAAEEDFGITPVEAQACGTPVIAFGKGGALETIRGLEEEKPTGVFYKEQKVDALIQAIELFEINKFIITPNNCRENALRFSPERFQNEFKESVDRSIKQFILGGYYNA